MTHGDALLAAIRAHPDEDTPRLAYADWLDEQGGRENAHRAQFIRLQIMLHGTDSRFDDHARSRRRKLAFAIQLKYARGWEAPLIGEGGPLFGRDTFTNHNRGFIDRVGGSAERWISHGDAVFDLAPVVRATVSNLTHDRLKRLAGCAWLPRIHTFEMNRSGADLSSAERSDSPPDMGELAAASLTGLKSLWFSEGTLDPRGARRIAAANPMPILETLQLHEIDLRAGTITDLFGGAAFAQIRSLYFNECGIGRVELAALSACGQLAAMEELELIELPDGDGLVSLARAPFWQTLKRLTVRGGDIPPRAMRAIASNRAGLEDLSLMFCKITDAGAVSLAAGDALLGLKSLCLQCNQIGDAGAVALARSPHLSGLKSLYIGVNEIQDDGVVALARCPALSGLEELTLTDNPIGERGYAALAQSPYLNNLRELSVGDIPEKDRELLVDRFGARVQYRVCRW